MDNTTQVLSQKTVQSKRTKKEVWTSVFKWSLPSLITLFVIVFAMICNGISPFGSRLIGYIDFDAGLVPAYNHLWDLFHGKANLFADWNLGGGSNAYASWAGFLFSPLDWIVCIFPRAYVANAIALVYIIKMCLMALTAYWLFKKLFKNTNNYVITIMAILWAFSGWMFVHYTNIGWLDIMILLPVFVYGLIYLKNTGKNWLFTLVLTWMLLLSYYITYMLLLGLVVCTFIYFFVAMEKGNRRKYIAQLFFGTITAILISCVIFIPSCITSLQAHRFSAEGLTNLKPTYFNMFFSKAAILLFYSLPLFLFYKLCFKCKQDKLARFFVIAFGFLCIGLVIEPINMMWHTGSYYSFPYRYSYVLLFFLALAGLYWIDKYCEKDSFFKEIGKEQKDIGKAVNIVLLITFALVMSAMVFVHICGSGHPYKMISFASFMIYLLLCVAGIFVLFMAFKQNKKMFTIASVILVCIIQVFGYSLKFIGNTYSGQQFDTSNVLAINTTGLEENYRLKDRDNLYISNTALETKSPSLATWIHISSENQWQTHHKLGYHTHATQLSDNGGTLFSDMLLGTRYVMSEHQLNDTLFTYIREWNYDYINEDLEDQSKTVYLYECNYYLPYVFAFNSDDIAQDFDDKTPLELQNWIYKTMFNKTDDIIKDISATAIISAETDENGYYTVTVPSATLAELYFYGDISEIVIDEKEYKTFADGFTDLGTHNTNFTFKAKSESINQVVFAKIEVADIQTFANSIASDYTYTATDNSNTINITYNNTANDKYLFVPLTYLNHYTISVNGQTQDTTKALNGYLMISLAEGQNDIKITLKPQFAKISLIITLVGIFLFVLFLVLNHFFHLSDNKIVGWIGTIGALAIVAAVAFLIYLKPLLKFVTGKF